MDPRSAAVTTLDEVRNRDWCPAWRLTLGGAWHPGPAVAPQRLFIARFVVLA
jgi:hypothetical protein